MRATKRASWLRLAFALVLTAGLSSAVAATAADSLAPTSSPSVGHYAVSAAAVHSIAVRSATALRHASGKHHPPGTATALAAMGVAIAALAAVVVRRRRSDHPLRHHAFSDGARAPPTVSCC